MIRRKLGHTLKFVKLGSQLQDLIIFCAEELAQQVDLLIFSQAALALGKKVYLHLNITALFLCCY